MESREKIMEAEKYIYRTISSAYNQITNGNNFNNGLKLYNEAVVQINRNKKILESAEDIEGHMGNLEKALDKLYESRKEALE